ncbi:MAG: phage protein Gp27 family protein [Pseudolabrys sp.]
MAKPKTKRGRLSSLDTLPEWADEAKLWAFGELKERKLTQEQILEEFNDRLRVAALLVGVTEPPEISRSAFNRAALRLALLGRRLEETREIAKILAPKLDQEADSSLTLTIAETIKTLTIEMLSNAGELSADGSTAEMLMFASRSLKHAEEAKRISSDTRKRLEDELKAKTVKVVDMVGQSQGLSAETVEQIKAKILGVNKDAPHAA